MGLESFELQKNLGVHTLLTLFDCDQTKIKTVESISQIGRNVIIDANLTLVKEQSHQFEPIGATALFLLSESHLSIHTWPEKGLVACDIFCCTDKQTLSQAKEKVELATKKLVTYFGAKKSESQVLLR